METEIRILEIADASSYKELRLQAFQESPLSFSESIEDESDKPIEFFQAFMGFEFEHFSIGSFDIETKQLVAIATFKRDTRSKARHKSYIHTMYVTPEHRGKGIALSLLSHIIENCREMPLLEQIHLWVLNPETSVALKLYEKAGFVSQGAIVRKDLKINGTYVDAAYMTLVL